MKDFFSSCSRLIITLMSLVLSFYLFSCKKSKISEPPPVIRLEEKPGYTSKSVLVSAGDSVKIAWAAMRGAQALTEFSATKDGVNMLEYNTGKTRTLGAENNTTFEDSVKFVVNATADYRFKISSGSTSATGFIRIFVPAGISTHKELVFNNQFNTWVYEDKKAIESSAIQSTKFNKDFIVYFDQSQNSVFISSILQAKLDGLLSVSGTAAFFRESSLNFDALSPALLSGIDTDGSNQKIKIEQGKVYEFINGLGKKALLSIKSINTESDDKFTVDLDLKQQL
jgi:hypothetical protein